jgi:tetratricopeptide (TPR) repeat protein
VIYRTQGNYQKAIENYYLALQMDEKAGDFRGMSVIYNNIGNIYYNQGEYDKAKGYYENLLC